MARPIPEARHQKNRKRSSIPLSCTLLAPLHRMLGGDARPRRRQAFTGGTRMDDEQVARVLCAVADRLLSQNLRLDVPPRDGRSHFARLEQILDKKSGEFERLVKRGHEEIKGRSDDLDADLEMRVLIAAYLFGPKRAGPPPAKVRREILDLLRWSAFGLDNNQKRDRVIEFVTAYGAGWRRLQPLGEGGGWNDRWSLALEKIEGCVAGWTRAAHNWLKYNIQ